MRTMMEVNNVSIDKRDDPYRNYFLEKIGDPYDDRELPKELKGKVVRFECNKRTNLSCLQALELDVIDIVR